MDKCYYDILQVSKTATKEELSKKKKELSRKYHPDKLPHDKKEEGTHMIKQINEAYDILNDDKKREIYDMYGKEGLNGQVPNDHFGFNPFGMNFGMHNQQHIQIAPIKIRVIITLEEIFNGKNICEMIERLSPCDECNCTGFADKKNHKCTKCDGSGKATQMIRMGNQIMRVATGCNNCSGTGSSGGSKKCKTCSGEKVIRENYEVKYKLEKGITDGEPIPIIGEGHHSLINGKPKRGDILIFIVVQDHPIFKISNTYNLMMNMELTLVEALCGTVKSFKFLNGNMIFIDIIDPIHNGDTKMLSEYGLPHMNSTYKVGNLHINFTVKYPDTLDTEEHKKNIYFALTGNTYNYDKLHDIPISCKSVELQEINLNDNDNSSDENQHQNRGGVQCAQQ